MLNRTAIHYTYSIPYVGVLCLMATNSSLRISDETLRHLGYLARTICVGIGLYQLTILLLGKHASFIETYALIILGFIFTGAGKLKPAILVWPCRAWLTIGHIVGAKASPKDVCNCFMGTHVDALVLGNFLLMKTDQPKSLARSYINQHDLD
jgi:hypothetical protein